MAAATTAARSPQPSASDRPVLARLPLQIGTTSAWSAGRAAAALFPGFALFGTAISMLVHVGRWDIRAVGAVGAMLVAYAVGHILSAFRTRASDVLLFTDGLSVDGGRLHGHTIAWGELTAPYADVEDTTVRRINLGSIFMVALAILVRSSSFASGGTSAVRVWRLHVHRKGERQLVAETDRPIERDSMAAAAASVGAVVSGQRYVAEAPTIATNILTCSNCGGAAVPDDAPAVALQQRAAEKRLWNTLSIVAGVALLGWAVGTVAYIIHIEAAGRAATHEASKAHPKEAPAPHSGGSPGSGKKR
jgi:hypothetical protein